MDQTLNIKSLVEGLPDPEGAKRFFSQIIERNPSEARKLSKNVGLLSDVLTIAAFSPLLASTLLQNPSYISWLARHRAETKIRTKEELLESLARSALTNSEIEPHVLLARFRRRELLSIYLRDIRRLKTVAETTEELSNLADAVLEYALRIARQELDNRYGIPLEIDTKGRAKPARFSVISLGKLGSKELNYSSDIDLLFLYSSEGSTSGQGTRGAVTNREYFVKLAEFVTRIVGQQIGEGAAYRVDLRLRPHGRIGALAVSLNEALTYYQTTAQPWERQTLIRARASAGDTELFKDFFTKIESSIYPTDLAIEFALRNVKLSKEKINLEKNIDKGYNVKLGKGGIREIEFIAQALQIAYGGNDVWLREPHTLISLTRLADRNLLSETELTELFEAYDFLRRLEHRLQMEHGLQTHLVPEEPEKRQLVAQRMNFSQTSDFDNSLQTHTANVNRIFERVFHFSGDIFESKKIEDFDSLSTNNDIISFSDSLDEIFEKGNRNKLLKNISISLEKSGNSVVIDEKRRAALERFCQTSTYFAEMLAANPKLIADLPLEDEIFEVRNYSEILFSSLAKQNNFPDELAAFRIEWTKLFLEIAAFDVFGKISFAESKRQQTELAEASLSIAVSIAQNEVFRRFYSKGKNSPANHHFPFAVLGIGKLGGRGMDFGSDLDLILIYDEHAVLPIEQTPAEFYSRFAEILVTTLSGFTREGHLYRVDLRLRPDGKNGATVIGKDAFLNYIETRSAIWECLAYVKLRGVSGNPVLAEETEKTARKLVHEKALKINPVELRDETRRVRERLEREKTGGAKAVNIKYGAGGLLDVYFAMRFLQLRDDVPDGESDRSTQYMLKKLFENGSLSEENFQVFSEGHLFLSFLDHNLRLTVGRSNQLPLADKAALQTIAERMQLDSVDDLIEKLSLYRLQIRSAYESVFA